MLDSMRSTLISLALLSALFPHIARCAASEVDNSVISAKKIAMSSAVAIMASRAGAESFGAGVVLKKEFDGSFLIGTCGHVPLGYESIVVYTSDPSLGWKAEVIGIDPDSTTILPVELMSLNQQLRAGGSDLALIRIHPPRGVEFVPARIGDPTSLEEGESVITIGNPVGLKLSLAKGVVSALNHFESGLFVQCDLGASPGYSGGGLWNLKGELVGIVSRKAVGRYVESIMFALDIVTAMANFEALEKYGRVPRAAFGIIFGQGTEVFSVRDGSPAAKAGVRALDVVVSINSVQVFCQEEIVAIVKRLVAGTPTTITIRRGERVFDLRIVPSERP